MSSKIILAILSMFFFFSCEKDTPNTNSSEAKLIVKLDVDANQQRLGNLGTPVSIPPGNAGQVPDFNTLSAHYMELAPSANTILGEGAILYQAEETNAGGAKAIDFETAKVIAPGEVFFEIPISEIPVGSYEWVRLSLSYQNYDISFYFNGQPFEGTLASFVGYNTYLKKYTVKDEEIEVNGNRKQGYWGFETITGAISGQAPEGATTVPNPLFNTSPIPIGSCVVTGSFDEELLITGSETEDIEVTLSLSINDSFEWKDTNGNGKWDVDPNAIEPVVDMGLRGLVPIINN